MRRARTLWRRLSRLRRSDSGVAATELALCAPFLLLLLLGGVDLARYANAYDKVGKIAFSVTDVTAQYKSLTIDGLKQVFLISGQNLPGYVSGTNGVTILSSLYLDGTTPKVRWQCASTKGSKWSSKIGVEAGTANVSATLFGDAKDNVVVAEVYYQFKPIFAYSISGTQDVYAKGLFRPRLGALNTKPCT
ncbi:TadE/TadG family type IV pilus assembly protein [Methylopila musalis]|uniref:TadE/TadG family type IV pilus assembly protein n=1 Tax=Methylopila musalis TaxID=1134781 RepID=A0ABW3Z4P2_9HYPH